MTITTNRSHYKTNGLPKRAFNSMREAQDQARNIENLQGEAMQSYQCGECHLWHVGHADVPGIATRLNVEMMEANQKEIGYSVVKPSMPIIVDGNRNRTPPAAPAPANRFTEASAKLYKLSQLIEQKKTDIKSKGTESKRLEELAMNLFNEAAEHENTAKLLASEVQRLTSEVAAMKSEAQEVMEEISRVF
jgi:hypothetical protein